MAEELWENSHSRSIAYHAFPQPDAMLTDAEVEMPVSIQGKVRHKVMVPTSADRGQIEAKVIADPSAGAHRRQEGAEGDRGAGQDGEPGRVVTPHSLGSPGCTAAPTSSGSTCWATCGSSCCSPRACW